MPLEGEGVFLTIYDSIIIYDSHFYAQIAT